MVKKTPRASWPIGGHLPISLKLHLEENERSLAQLAGSYRSRSFHFNGPWTLGAKL